MNTPTHKTQIPTYIEQNGPNERARNHAYSLFVGSNLKPPIHTQMHTEERIQVHSNEKAN
jgi:hypothetical protein